MLTSVEALELAALLNRVAHYLPMLRDNGCEIDGMGCDVQAGGTMGVWVSIVNGCDACQVHGLSTKQEALDLLYHWCRWHRKASTADRAYARTAKGNEGLVKSGFVS